MGTDSCGFAISRQTGEGLRWENLPIPVYVHKSTPAPAHKIFLSAVDHWNMAWGDYLSNKGLEPFPLFDVVNRNMQYSGAPKGDGYNMLFFVEKNFSKYENIKVQAFTTMRHSFSGKLTDTDIIVNSEHYRYFYDDNYNTEVRLSKNEIKERRRLAGSMPHGIWFQLKQHIQKWFQFLLKPFRKGKTLRQIATPSVKVPRNQVDFASLMIHELGHVDALGHFEKEDHNEKDFHLASRDRGSSSGESFISVMEPKLAYGKSRRSIKKYDLDNLFCGYIGY